LNFSLWALRGHHTIEGGKNAVVGQGNEGKLIGVDWTIRVLAAVGSPRGARPHTLHRTTSKPTAARDLEMKNDG